MVDLSLEATAPRVEASVPAALVPVALVPVLPGPGLRAAGPTSGGAGATALLIFDAESPDAVEALLDEDPFWIEGLITAREILEWNVVLGSVGSSSGH
jgi:hypothetical protein